MTPQRKRQSQRKVADALFSKLIRLRDGCCQRCDTTAWLQAAHVISRGYRAIAYSPNNAMALCRSCHKWQTEHPLEGEDWFRQQLGSAFYDELRYEGVRGAQLHVRVNYPETLAYLRSELAKMEAAA